MRPRRTFLRARRRRSLTSTLNVKLWEARCARRARASRWPRSPRRGALPGADCRLRGEPRSFGGAHPARAGGAAPVIPARARPVHRVRPSAGPAAHPCGLTPASHLSVSRLGHTRATERQNQPAGCLPRLRARGRGRLRKAQPPRGRLGVSSPRCLRSLATCRRSLRSRRLGATSCSPSASSSRILAQNAGGSPGERPGPRAGAAIRDRDAWVSLRRAVCHCAALSGGCQTAEGTKP